MEDAVVEEAGETKDAGVAGVVGVAGVFGALIGVLGVRGQRRPIVPSNMDAIDAFLGRAQTLRHCDCLALGRSASRGLRADPERERDFTEVCLVPQNVVSGKSGLRGGVGRLGRCRVSAADAESVFTLGSW